MMRATPYWSVSPIAVNAYIPPMIEPGSARYCRRRARRRRRDQRHCFHAGLGNTGCARALELSRPDAIILAALPLPDLPTVR